MINSGAQLTAANGDTCGIAFAETGRCALLVNRDEAVRELCWKGELAAVTDAASAPLSFSPRSSSVQLRVCRSKERSCTADILPYRDCDEVRRFRFDCEAQKSHDVTITIDEDHRLIIECKGPDGKTAKQTSFDHE